MNIIEIINKKRLGKILTKEEDVILTQETNFDKIFIELKVK